MPLGTRTSTFQREAYREAAPFADLVLQAIENADPTDATAEPQIAQGIQFVQIPEFQGIGAQVGQIVAEALSGDISVERALERAQRAAAEAMRDAGYY